MNNNKLKAKSGRKAPQAYVNANGLYEGVVYERYNKVEKMPYV